MTRGQKRELAGGAASDEMISAAAGAPSAGVVRLPRLLATRLSEITVEKV